MNDHDDESLRYGLVQQWCVAVDLQCSRAEDVNALEDHRVIDCDLLVMAIYHLHRALDHLGEPYPGDLSATLTMRHALAHPEDRNPSWLLTLDGSTVDLAAWVHGPRGRAPRTRVAARLVEEGRAISEFASPFAIAAWEK